MSAKPLHGIDLRALITIIYIYTFTYVGAKVFTCGWWMGMYGSPSPKRHRGYSNNPATSFLDLGIWKRHLREKKKKVNTVKKYVNKDGKMSYVGTSSLKQTQSPP